MSRRRKPEPTALEVAANEGAETLMPLLSEYELSEQKQIMRHMWEFLFGPEEEAQEGKKEDAKGFAEKIKKAIDEGLGKEKVDPQLLRVALEWVQEQEGREYLSEITVNIVPYTVPDVALERIVAEADEEIVARIDAALVARKAGQSTKRRQGRPRKTLLRK